MALEEHHDERRLKLVYCFPRQHLELEKGQWDASAAPILHVYYFIGAQRELDRRGRIEDETSVSLATNNASLVHYAKVIGAKCSNTSRPHPCHS
jgi:hypothetical protein